MLKKFWYLFLVLFIEGSSLMAVELMGAKLLAPFYGSSLYVWTAILCITVLGLTLGYAAGGKISVKNSNIKLLTFILIISAILVFLLPVTASSVIALTAGMELIPGICMASLLLIVPPVFCFGIVGPIIMRLMTKELNTAGNVAGNVYFTSTLGGIIATFFFGFYLIPEIGLKFCSLTTAILLALLPFVYLIIKIIPWKSSEMLSDDPFVEQPFKANVVTKKTVQDNGTNKIKNSFYLFAALEGATVMAVELIAARMLAPYFGASLYVWTTVIGITLLSLALGYYFGGRIADKFAKLSTIHYVLLGAAVFLSCMHFAAAQLTMALVNVNLQIAVLLVSFFIILPPLLFLGMVPTLLIRYLTDKVENVGQTTGRVFTISSASGIFALPLLGFYIIPKFGLTAPSIVIALLVGCLPFVKLLVQKKYFALLFVAFIVFSVSQSNKAKASADLNIISSSEGLLGQVMVADIFKNGAGEKTNNRVLFVNRMGQTMINKNTNSSPWNYITFSSSVASILPEHSKALVLGLGGGSVANILNNKLSFSVDAIELDKRIAEIAKKHFALNQNIKVKVDDARHYIETTKNTYDLIFFDVFKGDIPPPHVLSIECFKKTKSLLKKDGIIIVNFNGFLSGETGRPGRCLFTTLQRAGFDTRILLTPGNEEERNTLFIASDEPKTYKQVRSPLLYKGKPVDLDTLFYDAKKLNLNDSRLFTDDKPNLEKMNIAAGNSWRKDYFRSFTKFFLDNGVPLFN